MVSNVRFSSHEIGQGDTGMVVLHETINPNCGNKVIVTVTLKVTQLHMCSLL